MLTIKNFNANWQIKSRNVREKLVDHEMDPTTTGACFKSEWQWECTQCTVSGSKLWECKNLTVEQTVKN